MSNLYEDEVLKHYGVKGMKWRRQRKKNVGSGTAKVYKRGEGLNANSAFVWDTAAGYDYIVGRERALMREALKNPLLSKKMTPEQMKATEDFIREIDEYEKRRNKKKKGK